MELINRSPPINAIPSLITRSPGTQLPDPPENSEQRNREVQKTPLIPILAHIRAPIFDSCASSCANSSFLCQCLRQVTVSMNAHMSNKLNFALLLVACCLLPFAYCFLLYCLLLGSPSQIKLGILDASLGASAHGRQSEPK